MEYHSDNMMLSYIDYLDYYNYNSSDNIYICNDLSTLYSGISTVLKVTTKLLHKTIKEYDIALTKDKIINSVYNSIDKNVIRILSVHNDDNNNNNYKNEQEQNELLEKEAFRQKELMSIKCEQELLRQIELEEKRKQKK